MSILTRPIEELLSYLLTRLHGGFLLQQLDHRNFQTNVSEGIYTLKDIQLNPAAINQNLSESLLHLFYSSISRITIQVPNLFKFLEDPLNISIHNITLDLCSANESGCSVIPEPAPQLIENDEDIQGITVLTKSIGSFLSKINLQASLIKIRIRLKPTDKEFLQLVITKLSFADSAKPSEDGCQKLIKIEGIRVNLMTEDADISDPQDFCNIFVFDKPIVAEVNFSKELLFIECIIDRICGVISFEQMGMLLRIFTGLKKAARFDDLKRSVLMDAIQAFGEDIKVNLPKTLRIREKMIRLSLGSLVVCTTLEPIGSFKKVWSYTEGVYPGVPTSHIVTSLTGIQASHSKSFRLRVQKVIANHFNYLSNHALDVSEIYASAKQSFFNEFFRNKPDSGGIWEIDNNKSHFCSGNIFQFVRVHTDFPYIQPAYFRPQKQDFKLKLSNNVLTIEMAAIDIHTNSALISSLSKLLAPSQSPPSKLALILKASIPYLRIQYQENLDKCFCEDKDWIMMCETSLISLLNSQDFEASVCKIDVSILIDELFSNILTISNVKFRREVKESVNNELLEDNSEPSMLSYYEPAQGTIFLKPGKHTEPYEMKAEEVFNKSFIWKSKVEEEMGIARANTITKINIHKLKIRLDPATLQKLVRIIPAESTNVETNTSGVFIDIESASLELLDRENTEVKHTGPSMFSYYSLDASVNRTIHLSNDNCVGLITLNASEIKIFSLTNCMKSKGKYTSVKVGNIEGYAKGHELVYAISQNPFEMFIDKTETENTTINISSLVISADILLMHFEFLSGFAVDIPKPIEKTEKKHIKFTEIFIDFYKNSSRMLASIESGSFETTSNNSLSTSIHSTIDSIRIYIQENIKSPHPIFSTPFSYSKHETDLISLGCYLLCTSDSLEFLVTLVNNIPNIKDSQGEASVIPHLSCMLGSKNCTHVSGNTFLSDEIRNSVLVHKLLDIHVNIGCCVLNFTAQSLGFLAEFIVIPKLAEEPEEVLRKDSDISSDDSDTFMIQTAGLAINPNNPSKITNINLQEYLNPNREIPKKKLFNTEPPKILTTKSKIIHHHNHSTPQAFKREISIHNLQPEHGCPNLRFSGTLFLIIVNLYSRNSYKDKQENRRGTLSRIMVKADGISIAFSKFPKKLHYSWRLTASVDNMSVHDYIIQSAVNTIFKYDCKYGRQTSAILKIEVSAVWPRPSYMMDTELIINLSLLPLKLNIDQYFVDFCLNLANWKPEEQVLMHQTGVLPKHSPEPVREPKQAYLQKLIIDTISLNIDYVPHNFEGRHPGASVLNMFQIQDFNLILPKIDIKGVKSLQIGITQAWHWWLEHIKDKEIYKLLSGIGPLAAIKNISGAFYEIVNASYSGNSMGDNTKKAILGLIKSLSVESITVVESFITGTYTVLMGVGSAAGINLPSRQAIVRPLHAVQCIVDRGRLETQHEKYKDS